MASYKFDDIFRIGHVYIGYYLYITILTPLSERRIYASLTLSPPGRAGYYRYVVFIINNVLILEC